MMNMYRLGHCGPFDRVWTGACAAMWALGLAGVVQAQSFSDVPGLVLSYQPSPATINGTVLPPRIYTTSPSIVVMPNGDYVVTDNIFGAESGASVSGTTKVFRSSDKGLTWTHLTTLTDMKRGSLFVSGGDLYLWGYRAAPGDVLLRKSTDGGATWTTPTDASNGLLWSANFGGTPNNPVEHDGRIWVAQGGGRIMSAPVGSDLLQASSWTLTNLANRNNGPFGSGLTVTEAQIVASPQSGVVILPKVGGLPNTVLIRAGVIPSLIVHPSDEDWVSLPGGEKKFGAAYDPVSEKFYVLSNPVLPAHEGFTTPELTRNTAAIISSRDLHHWDVEQLFLYSPNIAYEAFQYLNFDFDGDDMVVASRTAFDVGGNKPPRGHDSNLITFHKIENFRSASPDHVLIVDTLGNQVLREERTQHANAPLGQFTLGSSFSGAPLSNPTGVGQDANGDVYIAEQGGRVLRFDALGNFIGTVASSPVPLHGSSLEISQPAAGERAWVRGGSGNWYDLTNWYYWGRPDTNYEVANFGSAIVADSTVTLDATYTMKGLRFRSDHRYNLEGPGGVRLAADDGPALIDLQQGDHEVHVPVTLESATLAVSTEDSLLHFYDRLDLDGHTLHVSGLGRYWIRGEFVMNGGTLAVDGQMPFSLSAAASPVLDGTLWFNPEPGTSLAVGESFNLINGLGHFSETFVELVLPGLGAGKSWDTSTLYSNGQVAVVADPSWNDGDFNGDGLVDTADYVFWRKSIGLSEAYDVWRANFGASPLGSGASETAVPEPQAWLLVCLAMMLCGQLRGQRRSRGDW